VKTPGPPEVARDVEEALAQNGRRPLRIELVSPLGEQKGTRFAYRVDTDDGHRVKIRHFGSEEHARRHFELRAGLETAFAPALARYRSVLIEEWIEGMPLTELDAEARAEEAGALLGRLHARPLGPDVPAAIPTRKWRDGAESDLELLARGGELASGGVDRLRAEIRRRDPLAARAALIHLDFCAENMLIERGGNLRVIDNELVSINPAGLDLGRTFHRWPMSEGAWLRFFKGYRSTAPREPEPTGFWRIAATLTAARVFLARNPQRLETSIALLHRFAEGESLSDPSP
jgi:Ser/Thr protein kinase RdoA (MazF antagonist)